MGRRLSADPVCDEREFADKLIALVPVTSNSITPDTSDDSLKQRRYVFGGAHWRQVGRGRLGIVVTLESIFSAVDSQLLSRRLLAQTHVEF